MKRKIIKISKAILFCSIIVLSSCEKDLYENAINANSVKPQSFTKLVTFKEVPEVESFIKQEIGDISSSKYELGKSANNLSKVTSEVNKIVEVTDTIGNKNYSIRFVFHDTPENVFYNLIVNFVESGKKVAFVEKYTCDIAKFEQYKNSKYDFRNFQGKVDLYQSDAFFKKSSITNKTAEDPCDQLYYPSGDPIPTKSTFIYNTAQTGTGTGTGGSENTSGSAGGWSWSPGFSWSSSTNNDSGDGSDLNNGCCSCGDCGTHWYPPSQASQHNGKIATNPCEDTVPIGFIGLWTEPEKVQLVRASLPISLEQWQWLHGKDYFSDTVLNFLKTAGSGYLLNEYKKIALWAIDYAMTHPPRDNFSIWTMEYLQNNPNISMEQFENWFMGTSEGQDGTYDAEFWENPNLTFQQQNLPSFSDFYNAYPKNADGITYMKGVDLFPLVGGEVYQAYINPNYIIKGACALKVSRALNYSGVSIPNVPGTLKGADNKYYFVNAKALNIWMKETFGVNDINSTKYPYNPNHINYTRSNGGLYGQNYPQLLSNINGIYTMIPINSSTFGASGHCDMIKQNWCPFGCFFKDVEFIDIWQLN